MDSDASGLSKGVSASEEGPINPTPLSKNAQKKQARAARMAEQKKERRAIEKAKKKLKKKERADVQRAEEEAERGDGEIAGDGGPTKKKARTDPGPKRPFQARVVVDLGFDDLMSENEIKSLTSQLAFTYSANRKAMHPFSSLLFTSLNGRTYTRLENISNAAYKRWIDTDWWEEGYGRLWADSDPAEEDTAEGSPPKGDEGDGREVQREGVRSRFKKREPQTAPQESVIYLTADSPDELTVLKEGETYIIGGICDHNRYKNLCFKKAQDTQVRSARLPIGTYLSELKTRKVLTVNQTFEILLKWVETRDWEQALYAVVPRRKFQDRNKGKGDEQEKEEGAEAEVTRGLLVGEEQDGENEQGEAEKVITLELPAEVDHPMATEPQDSVAS